MGFTEHETQSSPHLLEEEMATHSSILAWKIPWTEEPGRLQSMGSKRAGPDKDLEGPSSTRLEALVPSRDSRAIQASLSFTISGSLLKLVH